MMLPIIAKLTTFDNFGRASTKEVSSADRACQFLGYSKAKFSEVSEEIQDFKSSDFSAVMLPDGWFKSKDPKVFQFELGSKGQSAQTYKTLVCERNRKENEPVQEVIETIGRANARINTVGSHDDENHRSIADGGRDGDAKPSEGGDEWYRYKPESSGTTK
jgi:hypothetical protein